MIVRHVLVLVVACVLAIGLMLVLADGHALAQNTAQPPAFITKWGSQGSGDGQFESPTGITTDSSGNVYVADTDNNRIQVFHVDGKNVEFVTKWPQTIDRPSGTENGHFSHPWDVATDSAGNVYVADTNNSRIQKFDSNGKFLTKWGQNGEGRPGHDDGQFDYPGGIATDSKGNVYVADTYNDRVQKFDSNGKFLTKWGQSGAKDGQFDEPSGIAIDHKGNVYVTDYGYSNSRIQKFDSNGKYITSWGKYGSGNGQFAYPWGVATDSKGNIYITEHDNHRIQKFDSNGKYITKWGESGPGEDDGKFFDTGHVTTDSSDNVYVVDSGNDRIQKFG